MKEHLFMVTQGIRSVSSFLLCVLGTNLRKGISSLAQCSHTGAAYRIQDR